MAISTSITVSQALTELKELPFPEIAEGEYVWYPGGHIGDDVGHRFRWNGTEWVSDPADMPV
tara:strand:- start:180 stop:365 length:186 start_codon:yes stop_codon:yes gene_type:complete